MRRKTPAARPGKKAARTARSDAGRPAATTPVEPAPRPPAEPPTVAVTASDAASKAGSPPVTAAMTAATSVDHKLVAEAARWIQHKVAVTLHRGLLDIGGYVFERFYDSDPELVESTDPRKHVSLRALAERCDSVELPLSRTALYNAVRIAVMDRRLGQDAVAFKHLPSTHQASLLPLRDPAKIEKLAERALAKELTVRELREIVGAEIALHAPTNPARGRPPLPTVLKSLRAIARQLTQDGPRMGWTKAQTEELDEEQAKEARKLAESIHGAVGKLVERLGQGG